MKLHACGKRSFIAAVPVVKDITLEDENGKIIFTMNNNSGLDEKDAIDLANHICDLLDKNPISSRVA